MHPWASADAFQVPQRAQRAAKAASILATCRLKRLCLVPIALKSADSHTASRMKLTGIVWLHDVVDKVAWKHNVATDEVEEVLNGRPRFRFIEKGDVKGEHLYAAMGQTGAGRYLVTYFVRKTNGEALIVSARDMTAKEKKSYAKK